MPTPIFYKKPIIIDRTAHRDLKIKFQPDGFSYAAATNSIPLALAEFPAACLHYPIVFITDERDGGMPVTLTGLRSEENLFVQADGKWDANYVPMFVRRYPFILQASQNGSDFGVMVDSEAAGFNAEDGQRLFNEDGSNSAVLTNALTMLNQFNAASLQTTEFIRQLRKHNLLTPRGLKATLANGKDVQLNGFSVIDETKVNALSDADLLSLTRAGHLSGIYAHLISLAHIERLVQRLDKLPQG